MNKRDEQQDLKSRVLAFDQTSRDRHDPLILEGSKINISWEHALALKNDHPLTSLAFSVYSGEGVYALLLGSGLSRAAQIATGWEVFLDLIRNIAAVEGQAAIQKEVGQGTDLRRSCTG